MGGFFFFADEGLDNSSGLKNGGMLKNGNYVLCARKMFI